ncbi:glycerophosphodiester phosphodiesterase family protein [Herbiconiux moechotypicola]|uniref:Glycerophosphodiester phosphodiesterase n=1 Tax=Herbiconiux moechotypicola TaxID=637393 RepID=A0ABN3E115_9MICO|nr:glycerophosphodiester phosphodiesterase family protein [Herbiconiux moechotypicola]MCS5731303.1 glycerophosphodiester phosphodiesterase family protein [Herbiconiux moechotypicola]
MTTAYFDPARPRIFAHRGLATHATENTLAAFRAAVDTGADYVETDVHASRDGVAVVAHDPTLERIAGRTDRVDSLSLAELRSIDLGDGLGFPTLEEALLAFPDTRFNIDVKSVAAAEPTARAIAATGAAGRVLLTSFSRDRRRAAMGHLARLLAGSSGRPAAASAAAEEFVPALVAAKLGLVPVARALLREVDAVQIPTRVGPLRTTTEATIRRLHAAGVEVHVWTINDLDEAAGILARGADGIVTDRADAVLALVERRRGRQPS